MSYVFCSNYVLAQLTSIKRKKQRKKKEGNLERNKVTTRKKEWKKKCEEEKSININENTKEIRGPMKATLIHKRQHKYIYNW